MSANSPASLAARLFTAALLATVLTTLAAAVNAQEYPNHPVRIIVPFSPGGAVDGPTRVIAQELSRQLKQPVFIENKPGAGATIGADLVAKSPADGYTLLLASQTNAISASLYKKLPYDSIEDFEPISLLGREPGVLVVHPSVPVASVAELVAYARGKPGQINYASSGNGSGQHLFTAMFASMAGIQLTHVPYRGSAPATTDLLAGVVPLAIPGTAGMVGHIKAGRLRALAVSGSSRSTQLPDIPTIAESGFPEYSAYVWMGLLAPRGTPADIIGRLEQELKIALASDEVKSYFTGSGIEIVGSSPAEFRAYFREERDRWSRVIKETGAKVD